jgi:hypothetical protein
VRLYRHGSQRDLKPSTRAQERIGQIAQLVSVVHGSVGWC